MDHPFDLVADVLRRKLPAGDIAPGDHQLAGTALVDLDVSVAKSAPSECPPPLPWKSIVAVLALELGKEAIVKAARRAAKAEDVPLPAEVEAALEKVRAKLPTRPREGPTKVTGRVEVVGFAPATVELPGWTELRQALRDVGRVA